MAFGSAGPIEAKVSAATGGAAAATVVVWLLQTYVFDGQMPPLVELAIQTLLIALATFLAGWSARHTPRTDPAATGRHHWRE